MARSACAAASAVTSGISLVSMASPMPPSAAARSSTVSQSFFGLLIASTFLALNFSTGSRLHRPQLLRAPCGCLGGLLRLIAILPAEPGPAPARELLDVTALQRAVRYQVVVLQADGHPPAVLVRARRRDHELSRVPLPLERLGREVVLPANAEPVIVHLPQ